jgi:hypothetical protein
MTAQVNDRLTYKGQHFALAADPLGGWLARRRNKHIRFKRGTSACWRGYVASWEIVESRLYLVAINAKFVDGRAATLADLFPETPQRVPATWLTGELRCPTGAMLGYIHSGYSSIYERDLFLRFEQGELVQERTVTNEPPVPDEYDLLDDIDAKGDRI